MSSHREPLEPDDVIDATAKTPTERARRVAGRAYSAASSGVRNVREATSTSRLIEAGENGVNRAWEAFRMRSMRLCAAARSNGPSTGRRRP